MSSRPLLTSMFCPVYSRWLVWTVKTLMAGLPDSGKDHWLALNRGGLPIVSLDELRREPGVEPTDNQGKVAQLAKERCRQLLRAGTSFVFNATNTMRQTRSRWLDPFAEYDARIEVVYLEPPSRTCSVRIGLGARRSLTRSSADWPKKASRQPGSSVTVWR